ncbi:uncharacterized protein UHOD_20024 [Ustilago sp. UG-2017b]|nr:uncharacterized protein UHOD_20024 [Ustilago sp. UG-2017b]
MSSTNADLYDLTIQSHLIVESFLLSQNYTCTASALRSEALCSGLCLASLRSSSFTLDPALDLRHLVESYNSTLRAKQGLEKASQLASTYSTSTTVDPLSLPLPGPSTLAFKLERTHSTLHASNILSISKLLLLRRRFDTSSARYVNRLKETLVTSGADRRIVFSDPKTGEIEEILEDGKEGHQAAVLSVAQDPSDVRCVVSSGMDARVVVWDVVRRRVVQVLREHGSFVVKVAFSGSGEYLASIGYDKKVVVYRRTKRTAFAASQGEQEEKEEQEEQEQEELQGERYVKVWEKETQTNPESILFIRASPSPPTDEDEQGIVQRGGAEKGEVVVREAKQKRTWLCYTVRNDSFIHYLSLPLSADCDTAPDLYTTATAITPTPDWTVVSLNTNPNALDLHVSYSLLSLSLHPSGLYICIQTGDQTGPTWRASTSSNTAGSLSRLLLLPLLSGKRAATVWTGVATSSYAVPRHSWLPSGRAVWLNGEDGIVSLVDVKGRIRARVAAHGIASSPDRGERQAATSWTRGGNTIVKDLVVLGEGEVASCGFDRTVRVIAIDSGVLA